jgi:hypothetical protein
MNRSPISRDGERLIVSTRGDARQSKEADAILPGITPKDGDLDESHSKPVWLQKPLFNPVDIGVSMRRRKRMFHGFSKGISQKGDGPC